MPRNDYSFSHIMKDLLIKLGKMAESFTLATFSRDFQGIHKVFVGVNQTNLLSWDFFTIYLSSYPAELIVDLNSQIHARFPPYLHIGA